MELSNGMEKNAKLRSEGTKNDQVPTEGKRRRRYAEKSPIAMIEFTAVPIQLVPVYPV